MRESDVNTNERFVKPEQSESLGSSHSVKAPRTPPGKFKGGPAADKGRAVIKNALEKHGGPMMLSELGEALKSSGLDFVDSSGTASLYMRGWSEVERIGHGLYCLAGQHPRKLKGDMKAQRGKVNDKNWVRRVGNVLRKAFKDHDGPMKLTEMTNALRASGYKTNNFMGCVSRFIRQSNEFERVGYGLYRYKGVVSDESIDDDQPQLAPYTAPYAEITRFILEQMEKLGRPLSRPEIRHLAILHGHEAGDKLDWSIASATKGSRFKKVKFLGYAPADKSDKS